MSLTGVYKFNIVITTTHSFYSCANNAIVRSWNKLYNSVLTVNQIYYKQKNQVYCCKEKDIWQFEKMKQCSYDSKII